MNSDENDRLKVAIPFGDECRAEAIGNIQEFAHCLSKHAPECPFATPFGYAHFCEHPRWIEIARNTPSSKLA